MFNLQSSGQELDSEVRGAEEKRGWGSSSLDQGKLIDLEQEKEGLSAHSTG